PSSNPAGIYLYGCQKEMVFYNTISVSSSSASAGGYGLHIHNGNALAEGSAFIINNFISLSSNAEVVAFGILLRNSPDRKIYSNTINISGSNSLSQSFRAWESSENFSAHNNIFANHAGGHAFSSDAAINFTSDYNDLYTSGSMLTPDYSTLDQWQTATSKDQHSISVVPGFISNDDLHIDHACADLNGAGKITLTGNPKIDFCMGRDIDLEVRDAASPDIGADEYTYISEKKDFLTYGFNDQTGDAIINTDEHTISAEVEYGTDLSSLVAMFAISENASVAIGMETQTSGVTVNDFTSPVVYTVTAEDGTEQDWTVTVTCALNDSTGILAYSLDEQTGTADIDANNHTIEIEVPFNTDLTQLVAGFVLSTGASASVDGVSQESDVTVNDFTSPAIYTVTAENGTEQEWTITVTKTPNAENDILSFSFAEQSSEATIDAGNHSIEIQVVYGTDLTSLVASFTISEGAAISIEGISQESGVSINDFNTPVTYTIISQTNNSQEWIVSVTADEEVAFHEMTDLEFEIHPNPASNYVYIKSNLNMTDVLNIELIDITGCPQVMYRSCLYGDQVITMELSDGLADGLYFIKIKTAKRIFMQRIIIK
ncbi:MAG: T9SS type A sorting domain-containing protein, partial [Bacteroidales bacterium]|nr:T9SS type A sorting domain-containing protein [Bacteroidales bacterium]